MKHEESSVKLLSTDLPINVAPLHLSLCRGRELKVDGCVFMRVLKGDAVFSINASQVRIESGMLLYLAFDMTIISVQDAELDVECLYIDSIVTGEIFFNITSSAFWGFIYASPAFIPAPGLEGYMKRWFEQTQWIQKKFASNVVQATLRNEVETLFVVLAAEIEGIALGGDHGPAKILLRSGFHSHKPLGHIAHLGVKVYLVPAVCFLQHHHRGALVGGGEHRRVQPGLLTETKSVSRHRTHA